MTQEKHNFTTELSQIRASALPLEQPSDFSPLIERAADAQFVLIGDASHGTHDFYKWRAEISKQLIAEYGFTTVAVEADQSSAELLDQCVRLQKGAPKDPEDVLRQQRLWPSWMWANRETVDFCNWLRGYNANQPADKRTAWQGLDRYSLWKASEITLTYLSERLGWTTTQVNAAFDAPLYGKPMVPQQYLGTVAAHLANVISPSVSPQAVTEYYENLLLGGDRSMNARSRHWLEVLEQLPGAEDNQSRVIIWAHNTHIGDARGTNTSATSLGQLIRERYADKALLVGFAAGSGSVIAAPERGGVMDTIPVPAPHRDSIDGLLRKALDPDERALFIFPAHREEEWLAAEHSQRAIGAVYDASMEAKAYVPTRLGQRYDALVWCAHSTPVDPLHYEEAQRGSLQTLRRT